MDQSLIIGIGLVAVGLVIVAAMMTLFVGLVVWKMRSSSKAKTATQSAPAAKSATEKTADAPAAIADKSVVAKPAVPSSAPPPVPAALGGKAPVSYFDDDLTGGGPTPPKGMPGPPGNEGAKTELFQRGAHSFDWDDDSEEEEGGATEVFSAHHLDDDGEFTIED